MQANQDAYNLLQQLLAKQPDADLYIQAALLAVNQKKTLRRSITI